MARWCIMNLIPYQAWLHFFTVCRFSSFWHHFDLIKLAQFDVSMHFSDSEWEEWHEFWHAGVSWPHSELISLWSWCCGVSWPPSNVGLLEKIFKSLWEEWPEIWHADVSWLPSEVIRCWSWSVGTILTCWVGVEAYFWFFALGSVYFVLFFYFPKLKSLIYFLQVSP